MRAVERWQDNKPWVRKDTCALGCHRLWKNRYFKQLSLVRETKQDAKEWLVTGPLSGLAGGKEIVEAFKQQKDLCEARKTMEKLASF